MITGKMIWPREEAEKLASKIANASVAKKNISKDKDHNGIGDLNTIDTPGKDKEVQSFSEKSEPEVAPSVPTETPEYQKYLDMQKEYIKEYLGREDFSYDVNADELYRTFRKQALDTAERARRDTVAQAAGLTGGYGSTYATKLGSAAYNDVMRGADEMIPELYEAALSRYESEGNKLLEKADLAGSLAEILGAGESGDYNLEDILTQISGESNYEAEQKVHTALGKFDYDGDNNSGASIYDEAMRIFAGVGTGKNSEIDSQYLGGSLDMNENAIRKELMTWETKDGERLGEDEVNYLLDEIRSARLIKYYDSLVDSSGRSLQSFLETMQTEDVSGEEAYKRLTEWRDKSGAKLSEEDILYLMAYI